MFLIIYGAYYHNTPHHIIGAYVAMLLLDAVELVIETVIVTTFPARSDHCSEGSCCLSWFVVC